MSMGITALSCNFYQEVRFAPHNRSYFDKIVKLGSGLETVNDF